MSPEAASWVATAEAVGQHALPAFCMALALWTVLAYAGVRWRHAHHARRARTESPDEVAPVTASLVLRMAASLLLLVAIGMSAFAAIARRLGPDSPMVLADHALSDSIAASTPEAAFRVLQQLTHLGEPWVLAAWCVIVGAGLWRRRQRVLAVSWVLAVAGNAVLNVSLKGAFERARPAFDPLMTSASGFSFPSGHSSGAMVTYGMLAWLAFRVLPHRWQIPAATAALSAIFITAASRVFLKVHFASDVLAGVLSGGLWLALCIASAEGARHYKRHRKYLRSRPTS